MLNLGSIGTRQSDIDKLIRRLHSKSAQLVFVYEAGLGRAARSSGAIGIRYRHGISAGTEPIAHVGPRGAGFARATPENGVHLRQMTAAAVRLADYR